MRPLQASSQVFRVAGLLAIAALPTSIAWADALALMLAASAQVPLQSFTTAPDRVGATSGASAPALAQADQTARARAFENYGKLPLSFEANQGQTDSQAKFVSRGPGYTLFLTGNEAVLALKAGSKQAKVTGPPHAALEARPRAPAVLRMQLLGANRDAQIAGSEELPGKSNYFIGKDPAQWHTNISNYSKVRYSGIYPGVDLVYYGNQRQLEYDFVVVPGGDPGSIRLGFKGARSIRVDASSGDLILQMKSGQMKAGKARGGELRFHRPVIYQNAGSGPRTLVDGRFVLHTSKVEVGFEVAAYDRGRPLIIDPVLAYSTYLGGSLTDQGLGIAVDASGNAYVTGFTGSADFPTTPGASQTALRGVDAFVTKLNATGAALLYSTYLGGSSDDFGYGIALDATGNAYVTGFTSSADFPTTPGAYQTANRGGFDAFVTKLNATGTALLYSTYLGGSEYDQGQGIAVDASGNAYVTGYTASGDFPTTPGAYQTAKRGVDAFVTKLNATGALLYSTYLGGSSTDYGFGIAVDASGNAYVTGVTASGDFPTTPGAYQTALRGVVDACVTKLNATGAALLYSTYLGGSGYDQGQGIAVDASGNAYVTGYTASGDFPTTPGAYQTALRGVDDAFVTKLNATGAALLYSTYLGGTSSEHGQGIAVDASGNAYVTGFTGSADFPTTPGAYQTALRGVDDAFVTQLNATGAALLYSTYLGGSSDDFGFGIAVDASGNAYVTGVTASGDFPTTPGAYQTANRGGFDAFVVKFGGLGGPVPTTLSFTAASATTSDLHDAAQVQARLTTAGGVPVPNETVTFTLGSGSGAPTCSAQTDATGTATCLITPNQAAGPVTLTATFAGNAAFAASSASTPFTVTREETVTKFTAASPTLLANGSSATFSATLKEDGVTPIPGRTLTFTLGSGAGAQSCSGPTGASGTANCSIVVNQPLGPNTVKAVFAGDAFYQPSSDAEPVIVFAFLGGGAGGSFVIGNLNGVAGNSVEFWGAQWANDNSLSGGPAPDAFKGFADQTSTAPPACGGMWTTRPGNSSQPPATVPSYMAVIASSSIGKSGSTISGDIPKVVIVKTDPGYQPNPGHAGTGTVVAVLCGR